MSEDANAGRVHPSRRDNVEAVRLLAVLSSGNALADTGSVFDFMVAIAV